MILFYTQAIKDNIAILQEEEARHCTKTLRKKIGDKVHVVNGLGDFYRGVITGIAKKSCTILIHEKLATPQKRTYKVHIAIAPPKNINRFEWFLEKATEIGVDIITPLWCQRSERKTIRMDRLNKVLIAAMKQSLKATRPLLNPMTPLAVFMQNLTASQQTLQQTSQRYIAHCQVGEKAHLQEKYQANQDVVILIGPEGDFSPTEIALAQQNGFEPVTLGKSRLRTETAGIVACHVVALGNR